MCNIGMFKKLKLVFNTKNRFAIVDKLFYHLKFENINYETINRCNKLKRKTNIIRITINFETFIFFFIFFNSSFIYF